MQKSLGFLQGALEDFGICLDAKSLQREIYFIEEMRQWNKHINLTAMIDPLEMVEKHLIDSLMLLKCCHDGPLLDVGSGAGLPGLPLAIARSAINVVSIETVGKKCAFQKHIKRSLKLTNYQVYNERIENHRPGDGYPQIVARAFAKIEKIINYTKHLTLTGTRIYLMLGAADLNIDQLKKLSIQESLQVVDSYDYVLPVSRAKRKLLTLEKQPS
jgi:16S rRNA (guanine527-N7)-methyltransferase